MNLKSTSTFFYDNLSDYTFTIPKYSKVVDIIMKNNELFLFFLTQPELVDDKTFFVKIIGTDKSDVFIFDNYKFLKTITHKRLENNIFCSNSNNITINPILIENNYLVFINDNKQIDELRDDKLNELI